MAVNHLQSHYFWGTFIQFCAKSLHLCGEVKFRNVPVLRENGGGGGGDGDFWSSTVSMLIARRSTVVDSGTFPVLFSEFHPLSPAFSG